LDAAHRARRGAPADAAYTWQFALDRLLLGHATGSDALLDAGEAPLAPWPQLEGSALDALDALLRLLRVLARHERVLAEAMPPAQWRERLLALLDALLPRPPASPAGQRALERLRGLVDAFAHQAEAAQFDAPVPAELVRAHFAGVLAEADTRAPLLTGGVSFARMVPMRLLPFRAICLLGMDDGQFPRRDPGAGLNRLTAELGSERRRRGDRSTRDDDRFLFLQLFCSAQEVFYLSWLGADPRDGSVREPSALVSELLAAASACHAEPARAARELVLHHPLQPFAPAAFGAGQGDAPPDPRAFSYRGHWHPAAGRLAGARTVLTPWMAAGTALATPTAAERELSLAALRRFLMDPAAAFLQQRLGLRLDAVEAAGADVEPLQAPARGLQRSELQRAVFAGLLAGDDPAALLPRLCAQGLLPSGPPGRRALDEVLGEVAPYARRFEAWRGDASAASLPLEVEVDGLRLHGRLAQVWPQGIARLRFGARNGPAAIRHGLDWLLARAAGLELPLVEFYDDGEDGLGPHLRAPVDRERALAALRALLALRAEGLRRPLPFAPYSGWELYAAKSVEQGIRKAAQRWRGGHGWAEGEGEALRLALRGRDPFADADGLHEFVRVAWTIYGALDAAATHIDLPAGFDLPDLDAEEGA
ncbi:MAG: exodeoxyribonuclease V subunit gamma, partial [Pseudoxanthomonas sp.]